MRLQRLTSLTFLLAAALLATTFPAMAGKTTPPPSTTIALTTTFTDSVTGAGGSSVLNSLGSDSHGAYTTTSSTTSNLTISSSGSEAIIDSGWNFRTPTRANYLSFAEPATQYSSSNTAPFTSATVPAQFDLRCMMRPLVPSDIRKMTLSSSVQCPLIIHFNSGRATYRIGLNSDSPNVSGATQQGQDVNVTCTNTDPVTSDCTAWHLSPPATGFVQTNTAGQPESLGILFNQGTGAVLGYYWFSYNIDLVR